MVIAGRELRDRLRAREQRSSNLPNRSAQGPHVRILEISEGCAAIAVFPAPYAPIENDLRRVPACGFNVQFAFLLIASLFLYFIDIF